MKLVLRSNPSASATRWQRVQSAVIRWRLCSQWCHGAIVIGGTLYQSTPANGLSSSANFDPTGWTVIDLGTDGEAQALALFNSRKGAAYDWLAVLGFALPWVGGEKNRLDCFEWCALALGVPAQRWMTPERLLAHIATKGAD